MAQYTTALKDDFNTVRNAVRDVLNAGSGDSGYGSPLTSYTVAKGDTISHLEYDALKTDINVCYNHISSTTNATLASVVQGGQVTWANFVTYQAAATYITNNRLSFGGPSVNVNLGSKTIAAGWGQASGKIFARCTGTISWSSADACRYFFNQGNYISFVPSSSSWSITGDKTDAWKNLWAGAGFTYGRNQVSSGSSSTTYMSTNPYGYNPPHTRNDYLVISMSAVSSGSISFSITLNDGGQDKSILSNVGADLYINFQQLLSNQTGITVYAPTASINDPVYSAT
jgi:hypothetical protein